MSMVEDIRKKAQSKLMTIVLPEGDEPRTVQAAKIIKDEGYAKPVLLGNFEAVEKTAKETGTDITGIEVINPEKSEKASDYAKELYELRKSKGVTEEDAAGLVKDVMYYGIMMVKMGDADGLVSGAVHTTGDMLRPALQIIKTTRVGGN